MSAFDAILIPGGGVIDADTLPLWVQRRLDRALERYAGETIITLSAGTTYKPAPLDANGFTVYESVLAARYLIAHGIDPAKVLVETCSYDTIGNAYFSKVIHVDPAGFKTLHVITSAFHLPRTEAAFRWVYGLPGSDGAPGDYALSFEAVSDEGMDAEALAARAAKERAGLEHLQTTIAAIHDVASLHRWLFTEHSAYAMRDNFRAAPPPSHRAIDTY